MISYETSSYKEKKRDNDKYSEKSIGRLLGSSVDPLAALSIVIPIVAFLIGQAIQYVSFFSGGRLFITDLVFRSLEWWHLLIFTAIGIGGVVFTVINAFHLADDDMIAWFWIYVAITGVISIIAPTLAAIVCASVSLAVFLCHENMVEENLAWILPIIIIVLALIFMWFASYTKMLGDAEIIWAWTSEDIPDYIDAESVAIKLPLINYNDDIGKIETSSKCKEVILIGGPLYEYSYLNLITSATKITLKNVNVYRGSIKTDAESCTINVLGNNSIQGDHGWFGAYSGDGEDGKPPITGRELIFTGFGKLTLTAGNGGRGGDGINGESGGLFFDGTPGGNAGDGGDSSVVISCTRTIEDNFKGKILLIKGTPGSGGKGGKGGPGGILHSSGSDGRDGIDGSQGEYTNGEILIDEKHIKYE